jgi:hypothetical protein
MLRRRLQQLLVVQVAMVEKMEEFGLISLGWSLTTHPG